MRIAVNGTRGLGIILIVALLAGASGCGVLDSLNISKPSANVTGVSLRDISLSSATLLFDVEVGNPYSVPLPLVNLDYGLASSDTPFLSGQADLQGTVPARGKKTVSLPAKVTYLKLLEALKDVRPGSVVPYKADLGLSVDAPAAGRLRLPLKKEGQLPVPAAPEVSVAEIKWDEVTLDKAGGHVRLNMVNRNQFPVELARLAYALSLGDVEVARSGIAQGVAFEAEGGAGTVEIPISLSPKDLGLAFFRMLAGAGSGYKLGGTAELKTPFGPMSLPIEKIGQTVFRR